jgi:general secretion pathway protein F
MSSFAYRGMDARGRKKSGLLEADDAKSARKRLAERGIWVEEVRPAAEGEGGKPMRLPVEVRARVYRETAALLESGVPMVGALEVMLESPEAPGTRLALAAVRDAVRGGKPFSEAAALADAGPLERAVMEVGERTGGMDTALGRLAGFLEEQAQWREKFRSALLYPAVVAGLAVVLGGAVMAFLLPRMQSLLAETGMPVPPLTRAVFGCGKVAGAALLLAASAGAIGWPLLRRAARGDEAWRRRLERWADRLPLWGAARRDAAALRFTQTLALLLERGVGLVEGLPLAAKASGSARMAAEAERETEELAHGKPLAEAVRGIRGLPESLAAWIQAGQSGGNLPGLLEHAAKRMQDSWERRARRSLTLLEVGLTVAIGAFVAVLALAVLLPVLQVNKGILH